MSADSVTLRHSVYFQDLTDATCWWCTLCLPGPMKRIKNFATTSFSSLLTHAKSHGVDGNWKALIAPAAPGHAAVYEQAKVAHAAAAGRVVTAAAKRPKQQTTLVTRMCAFASRESVARMFCTTPIAFVTLRHNPEVVHGPHGRHPEGVHRGAWDRVTPFQHVGRQWILRHWNHPSQDVP